MMGGRGPSGGAMEAGNLSPMQSQMAAAAPAAGSSGVGGGKRAQKAREHQAREEKQVGKFMYVVVGQLTEEMRAKLKKAAGNKSSGDEEAGRDRDVNVDQAKGQKA